MFGKIVLLIVVVCLHLNLAEGKKCDPCKPRDRDDFNVGRFFCPDCTDDGKRGRDRSCTILALFEAEILPINPSC